MNDSDLLPDPREFVVPASDGKGHSERIWARIQPGHSRQMSIVLSSKWFPYRSTGDIVRHALQRHLRWLEGLAPISSILSQVDAIMEIMKEDEFNREFQEVIQSLTSSVGVYTSQGQIGRATALVSRVLDKVSLMPDSDWKDAYQKTIMDRFGHLIAGSSIDLLGK